MSMSLWMAHKEMKLVPFSFLQFCIKWMTFSLCRSTIGSRDLSTWSRRVPSGLAPGGWDRGRVPFGDWQVRGTLRLHNRRIQCNGQKAVQDRFRINRPGRGNELHRLLANNRNSWWNDGRWFWESLKEEKVYCWPNCIESVKMEFGWKGVRFEI